MSRRNVPDKKRAPAGIRDAVETAIDLSKRDKESTWEKPRGVSRDRIRRWKDKPTATTGTGR
jgi:hypothetical protein